ncbi:MAG: insulinase family protein [Betaproteobacteria bacterium]|nr:insulinase family protein [Betaproteobacteria bacterium]
MRPRILKTALARFMLPGLVALLAAFAASAAEIPHRVTAVEGVAEYRLENGLRVLTVPDPGLDTITLYITYLVGARHEGYGEKGMAHLLEHLFFKGSKRHPNIREEVARRGDQWNGGTGYDQTFYFITLAASDENLDWALGMEADRMVNAFIAKADLDSEMTVVRNEMETAENSPESVLFERMQRLAFAWHNYGNPILGTRSDLERMPIERLQAFYRTWYRPDNAVLILGGRFDEPRALELVARHFGAVPRPAHPLPETYTVEPPQDGERTVTLRRAGDTQLAAVMYRGPAGSHPDYAAMDVLTYALALTPTGRLHRALVQAGKASAVAGYQPALHDPGYVYFDARLGRDGSLEAARDALLETVEGVVRDPVREDEVEHAKRALLSEIARIELESGSLIRALSDFSGAGDWRLFFLYRDRLARVTAADVRRVAETYLKPANRVLGLFVPTDQPERTEIPPAPALAHALADYRGGKGIQPGEAFDPSPRNLEDRIVRRELANGMRVALLPKKTRGQSLVANLALYWGDEQSTMHRSVACTLAGEMLARGTAKRSRAGLRDALDRLKSAVSVNSSGAAIETRRAQLPDTLRLVAEMLRAPSFPPDEFEQLRREALTDIESRRSEPWEIAARELARYLHPYPVGHWRYTQSFDERMEALRRASLDDARRCYEEFFGATRAEFVAVGDFDPRAVMGLLEELFGDWKSPRPYRRVPERHFERPAAAREIRTPDKANAVLRAGLNVEMRDDHPDYPALVLANYLLGGSSNARIPVRVRENEGLSYSTTAWFTARALDATASFAIAATFAPANKARVEKAIREEIARARSGGFTLEETETAKKGLLQARRLERTRDRSLAGRLSYYLYWDRTFDWDVEFENRIAALTPDATRDALRRHLDPSQLSVVTAGDFR